MPTEALLGKTVVLEFHQELVVPVKNRAQLLDLLFDLRRIDLDAFPFRSLRHDFLFDHQVHRLYAELLQQLQLVAAGADLHALGIAILDVKAVEALVTDGLVVNANGITGVNGLRLRRRAKCQQRQDRQNQTLHQFADSFLVSCAAGIAIRLSMAWSE